MDGLHLELLFYVFILIACSAFFSSSETGMMALNRYRLKHLKEKGHKGAKRASNLLDRPDQLISLILIGNNLVNFTASALFTYWVIQLWGEAASITIGPIVFTLLVLIFAEISPKTIAALHPEKVAFPASGALKALMKVMFPLVWGINKITNSLLRMVGVDPEKDNEEQLSPEELRTIVGNAGPHISKRNQGMLLNILDLQEATVEDIMIPRQEIVGINLNDSDEEILDQLRTVSYTRLPVFKEDINNIVGMIHQRNVSQMINCDGQLMRQSLLKLMREPVFMPESTPLHTQLMNFQKQKRRIGIVVDEYGEVQGLATMEDILEEIVGEFTSNLATDEGDIVKQGNNEFLIKGSTTIRDINKALDWDLPTDGPKTLNGLLLDQLQSFPDASASIQIQKHIFEITKIKGNIIDSVIAFVAAAESS